MTNIKIKGKKNLINGYMFFSTLITGLMLLFYNTDFSYHNNIVTMSFILNGIVFIYQLQKTNKLGYSLFEMYNIFMFFFMFIAPFLQYLNNDFPWWDTNILSNAYLLRTNFLIFIFNCFVLLNYFNGNNKIRRYSKLNFPHKSINMVMVIGFWISLILAILIIFYTGFNNLFFRSTNTLVFSNSAVELIVNRSFKAFPLIMVIMHVRYLRTYGIFYNKIQFIILLILSFLLHIPTGMARFQVAVVYIAVLLLIKEKFSNKYFFKTLIVFGLLVLFPLINIFRSNTITDVTNLSINLPNPVEAFLAGDFDAFSMLVRSVIYVDLEGMTLGNQLLGSILFFVPRNLWPSKAVGSGVLIGKYFGWSFTNVSMPFIGEGYINFGLIGIFLFAIFLGKLIKKLDFYYAYTLGSDDIKFINILEVLYPLLLGYIFFMLRGDLLSSFAYTVGYTLPIIFLHVLSLIISRVNI